MVYLHLNKSIPILVLLLNFLNLSSAKEYKEEIEQQSLLRKVKEVSTSILSLNFSSTEDAPKRRLKGSKSSKASKGSKSAKSTKSKKSTKSTKSSNDSNTNDVTDVENKEFEQVGIDIPRTEGDEFWKVDLVSMSEDGQRFANTNNVYQYDESSQSWKSHRPASFAGFSILGMSGNGQDVLVGKLNDIDGLMTLELRTFNMSDYVWKSKGGGDITYTPLNSPIFGDGIMTENYAKLSKNGRRVVVTRWEWNSSV
ncbi:predicted protein [Chaetoceros tenuissimus]|uniref:Uncharacterized protein n=1 Tax=Chaetoceros tenuissimus TaxID=426638 RepID=A0AAD3CVC4_9STRA|nr:predicted protein [Chaetoceros tenuissimus]